MDIKAICRRLDVLQRIADENKPLKVKVLFSDGSAITVDQSRALDLLQELGPRGKIDSFQADGPVSGWAKLMTAVFHPAKNRGLEGFE